MSGSQNPFDKLCPEIRNRIWAYTLGNNDDVTISNGVFPEPAVLQVCKDMREEISPMFYGNRTFKAEIYDYSGDPVMLLGKKSQAVEAEFGVKMRLEFTVFMDNPNWTNMKKWLREMHTHKTIFTPNFTAANGAAMMTVEALCITVRELVDLRWEKVELILEASHQALIALDARWT